MGDPQFVLTNAWFDDMQFAIGKWAERNFPRSGIVEATLGLCEETGELARAVLKRSQGVRGTREEWDAEVQKELADVLIKLLEISWKEDLNLFSLVRRRAEEILARDFVANPIGHGLPKEDL